MLLGCLRGLKLSMSRNCLTMFFNATQLQLHNCEPELPVLANSTNLILQSGLYGFFPLSFFPSLPIPNSSPKMPFLPLNYIPPIHHVSPSLSLPPAQGTITFFQEYYCLSTHLFVHTLFIPLQSDLHTRSCIFKMQIWSDHLPA